MTRAKVFTALWIIAFDLHLGVAVFDRLCLVALLHLDDEFLGAVTSLAWLDAARLVDDRHAAHVRYHLVLAAIFFGCDALLREPIPFRFAVAVAC